MKPQYASLKVLSILAASFFLLVVAATWSVDSMFTMSACLLVMPVVSIIVCRIWLSGLRCVREPLSPMTEGEAREVTLTLGQRYFSDLTVRVWDGLPKGVRSDPSMPAIADLSGTSCQFHYNLEARKRGVFEIGPLRVGVHDPLGLVGMVRRFGGPVSLLVYPKPLELTNWMLASGNGALSPIAQAAVRAISSSGTDFQGTRKYYPGDDLRRVHWKSAARAGELIVSEYQEEATPGDVVIALDTQVGTDIGDGEKTTLDLAAGAASFIAQTALERGSRVTLLTGKVNLDAESMDQLPAILEQLARVKADSTDSLACVLSSSSFAPGASVAVISPRVDEELRMVSGQLLALGVSVAQVYVAAEPSATSGKMDDLLHQDIPCWRVTNGEGHGD
jgi:uncharacterized protein (DUF58 family)